MSAGSRSDTIPPMGRGRNSTTAPPSTTIWPPPWVARWLTAAAMSSGDVPITTMLLSSGALEVAGAPERSPNPATNAVGRFEFLP